MDRSTILVAGGVGKRMASRVPKQFLLLQGKPVLCHAIGAFHRFSPDMQLIVVLPKDQLAAWRTLCTEHRFSIPHTVVSGGAERFHSVQEGLKQVQHDGLVAVHDGVRPLVSVELIGRCFAAAEGHGAAIPVVPIGPSVRQVKGGSSEALDRAALRIVQTPQCFAVPLLRKAFELPFDPAFTDEATLVERQGTPVTLVEGEERNLKVTTPMDLRLAEVLLGLLEENKP
jgi:2-C-methyl-D-erythritol 4-phosphate cytidylyltransferase